MIPRNINPKRALQIAINGRDQLLQIPSGCFNLTDYGVECIADDMSVFAPWESIQWLEQSDDIDAVFNSYDNNNDGNNDYDDANGMQTNNPFNDNNINKTLLKKCLRYNIIIKDNRSGYFRVKFSNQILGRTINEVLNKINHNLKLKAFLIQESETMDNDNIMNAYNTDTEDDDTITDDTSPVIRKTRDNHNENNNDYSEPELSKTNDIQSQDDSRKSSYVTEDQLRQMIGDDKYDELMSKINKTSSDESNNTDSINSNANNTETVNNTDDSNDEDDDIIIDDGFEDYDDNDNNLVMNENKESEIKAGSSASHSQDVNANNNAHMMIPNLEDQSRNTIKPSRRKIKNNNKKTSDSNDNDASKTENTIPTRGFGMKTENANNNATVNNNEYNDKSEPEHLTAYKIDDNTPGNDDTKDENGYDYVILFTCDGFIGSIESRWKDYESALSKCNELNSSPNVKQSLVHIHYSVYKAKGTQLVNRKYQVLTADGLPDSSYNEYGEKIQ